MGQARPPEREVWIDGKILGNKERMGGLGGGIQPCGLCRSVKAKVEPSYLIQVFTPGCVPAFGTSSNA
jgi:hypothetical protein